MLVDLRGLNAIEEKLMVGYSLSSVDDIEPLKCVIVSFHRIWKWFKEYSELASKVDLNLFQSIFSDMSSTFSVTRSELDSSFDNNNYTIRRADSYYSKLSTICDYCDVEFPLLNNDVVFAYQMHEQTPEHIEVVNIFRILHSTTTTNCEDTRKNYSDVSQSDETTTSNCEDTRGNNSDCSQSDDTTTSSICEDSRENNSDVSQSDDLEQEAEKHSDAEHGEKRIVGGSTNEIIMNEVICEDDVWIENRGNAKFCILCNVLLPGDDSQLRSHINEEAHKENSFWIWTQGSKYYCDLCEVILISLHQLRNHLDGRRHEEGFYKYERINGCSGKVSEQLDGNFDGSADKYSGAKFSNKCVSSNNWIERRDEKEEFCNLCAVNLSSDSQSLQSHINSRIHEKNSSWIWTQGSKYYCTLCDVTSKSLDYLRNHLDGRKHGKAMQEDEQIYGSSEKEPKAHQEYDQISCSGEKETLNPSLVDINVFSPSAIYHIDHVSRLTYFLNKTCISFRSRLVPTAEEDGVLVDAHMDVHYDCLLCNIINIGTGEGRIGSHLLGSSHRAKVDEIIGKSNVDSVSFEAGIFHCEGRESRECRICNIKLPEDDAFAYLNHLETSCHAKAVQSHFISPLFKDWEKGIILRYGKPFCLFCKSCLPNETSMQKHINTASHKNKLNTM